MTTALDIAQSLLDLKLREEHGRPNRGPLIDEMLRSVGVRPGQPWCAAFVSWCFARARTEGQRVRGSEDQRDLNTPTLQDFNTESPPLRRNTATPQNRNTGIFFPSASSQAIKNWFQRRGLFTLDAQEMLRWKGALFGWTSPDGVHGHIGFVKERLTAAGVLVAFRTLEGNASPRGGRNGDGVYSVRRKVHPRFWFLNTSELAGGNWW